MTGSGEPPRRVDWDSVDAVVQQEMSRVIESTPLPEVRSALRHETVWQASRWAAVLFLGLVAVALLLPLPLWQETVVPRIIAACGLGGASLSACVWLVARRSRLRAIRRLQAALLRRYGVVETRGRFHLASDEVSPLLQETTALMARDEHGRRAS